MFRPEPWLVWPVPCKRALPANRHRPSHASGSRGHDLAEGLEVVWIVTERRRGVGSGRRRRRPVPLPRWPRVSQQPRPAEAGRPDETATDPSQREASRRGGA
jgi:hypothetical protein